MADEQKGVVAAGFSLLWRRQGVLWWVFVVNLLLGGLGAIPAMMAARGALGHSLSAEKLAKGFDLGVMAELMRLPYVNIMRNTVTLYLMAFLFLLFMMFVTGGILETYREDRRLNAGEFFAAAGGFFWRFVRLALLSIIPFVIVGMIYQGLSKAADTLGDRAIADQVGIFLGLAAFVIFLLLALWIRLWFDIAQVRAVVLSERGMWRNTWRSWRVTWRNLRDIYGVYLGISAIAWLTLALGVVVWAHLGPSSNLLIILVLEFIVFMQVMTRLWQLSSAMTWYQRNPEPVPVVAVVEVPAVETPATIVPEPLPPGTPDPELPPADA